LPTSTGSPTGAGGTAPAQRAASAASHTLLAGKVSSGLHTPPASPEATRSGPVLADDDTSEVGEE